MEQCRELRDSESIWWEEELVRRVVLDYVAEWSIDLVSHETLFSEVRAVLRGIGGRLSPSIRMGFLVIRIIVLSPQLYRTSTPRCSFLVRSDKD